MTLEFEHLLLFFPYILLRNFFALEEHPVLFLGFFKQTERGNTNNLVHSLRQFLSLLQHGTADVLNPI